MNGLLAIAICTIWASPFVSGHGRFIEPPSRSSIWRFLNDPTIAPYASIVEANYDDNQLFCGGAAYQQSVGGKCGVCGDAWDAQVKDNEAGGKYAKGIIVRQYAPESMIGVTVQLTAHHKGYFEFRLCPWNNPTVPVTHDCLNQYLLETSEGTKWMLPPSTGGTYEYHIKLKLPDGVECDQCVLQWRYHTGNSWGCDEEVCCLGCGAQEEFYGCADIAIGAGPTLPPPEYWGSTVPPITKETTTTKAVEPVTTTTTTNPTTTTTSTIHTTTTTTGKPMTTDPVDSTNPCPAAGPGLHMYDCYRFYQCSWSQQIIQDCPPGTVFHESIGVCDHPYNVVPPCGIKT